VGTPRQVYDHPADRFVADFIGESNFLEGRVRDHAGGRVLELADGHLLPVAGDAPLGPATLMVRPESTHLGPPPGEGALAATLPGRISHVAFLGDRVRLIVDTTAGAIVVDRPRRFGAREEQAEEPGEEASLWWSVERATVLGSDTPSDRTMS
jgi:ABC-type Fe3+/spermidine/putrescine transport system ATPase subunit